MLLLAPVLENFVVTVIVRVIARFIVPRLQFTVVPETEQPPLVPSLPVKLPDIVFAPDANGSAKLTF